jgi:hypothetical protein
VRNEISRKVVIPVAGVYADPHTYRGGWECVIVRKQTSAIDLSILENFPQLKTLDLSGVRTLDDEHLASLKASPSLEQIILPAESESLVSTAGIDALKQRWPKCQVLRGTTYKVYNGFGQFKIESTDQSDTPPSGEALP